MTTETPIPGLIPEARDLRRAAAMLIAADPMCINASAIAEVIEQVKSDLRITELMMGMAVLAYKAPADLGTEEGQRALWASYNYHLQQELDKHKEGSTDE